MSVGSRRKSREMALQALYAMDLTGEWGLEAGDCLFDQERWPESVPFAARLLGGVRDNRAAIDEKIQSRARNWSVQRMNLIDRNILRIAAFELLWCEDVPAGVSINEALELAKAYATQESSRFLNGILDKLANPPSA